MTSPSWRDHEYMWVIGCIDSRGAIAASPDRIGRSHRPEESRGKRWRWCVWSQEFSVLATEHDTLSDDELFTVCDWLVQRGYADAGILPAKPVPALQLPSARKPAAKARR